MLVYPVLLLGVKELSPTQWKLLKAALLLMNDYFIQTTNILSSQSLKSIGWTTCKNVFSL